MLTISIKIFFFFLNKFTFSEFLPNIYFFLFLMTNYQDSRQLNHCNMKLHCKAYNNFVIIFFSTLNNILYYQPKYPNAFILSLSYHYHTSRIYVTFIFFYKTYFSFTTQISATRIVVPWNKRRFRTKLPGENGTLPH